MTILEIAKQAGVSTSTVSRVFSHHPNIREEIRHRVLAVARQNGYHPRLSSKQRNVVIITPYDSVYPVQSCVDMILMALMQELPRRGFRLEVLPCNNLERLDSIQFCGAVAVGAEPSDFKSWSDRFPVPLVIVDRCTKSISPDVFFVHSDERQGMTLAIQHLHQRGCHRIGCIIHGDPGTGNTDIRYNAITDALRDLQLPSGNRLVCFSGSGSDRYVELIGKLLRQQVDALFCPGGNAGIVSQYAMSLYNLHIPTDISLIASEQVFFSQHAVPPQTTISPDYVGIATATANVLEKRLAGETVPVNAATLPYQLISRESVRDPQA